MDPNDGWVTTVKVEPDLVIDDSGYDEQFAKSDVFNEYSASHLFEVNSDVKCVIAEGHQQILQNTDINNNYDSNLPISKLLQNGKIKQTFKCDECVRIFPYTSALQRHMMQIHFFEKPYKCDICNRAFIDKSAIKMHMQVHSGIRPYRCKICNKPFGHPFNIKKHMLVHNGLRPYKCPECGKTYKHSSHLKRHMVRHNETELEKQLEKSIQNYIPKITTLKEKCNEESTELVNQIPEHYQPERSITLDTVDDIFKRLSEVLN